MENISTDTMLQILVTVAAALALWLRLDSKIDSLRKELKGDIQRVDDDAKAGSTKVDGTRTELKGDIQRLKDKIDALTNMVQEFRLETVERLTRLEERSESRSEDQPEAMT